MQGRTNIVAFGITSDGVKFARALGGLERERHRATALLSDLVERGLDMSGACSS